MASQNPCSLCGQHLQSHPVETVKHNDTLSSSEGVTCNKQATRNSDTQGSSAMASQGPCSHCSQTAPEVVENNDMGSSSEDVNKQATRNSDTQGSSAMASQGPCSHCSQTAPEVVENNDMGSSSENVKKQATRNSDTQGSSVMASQGPCSFCGQQRQPHPDRAKGFSKKNILATSLSQLFPSRPTVTVFSLVTGETFDAHKSLLKKVKNVMSSTTKMKIVPNRPDSDIIIVFCPIVSRVGSDVGAAMMKMKDEKPVILVIMHHTRKDNYSTHGRKWSEIYPIIIKQVQILFHETQPGLLKCHKNDQAVVEIQNTLCRYSQR